MAKALNDGQQRIIPAQEESEIYRNTAATMVSSDFFGGGGVSEAGRGGGVVRPMVGKAKWLSKFNQWVVGFGQLDGEIVGEPFDHSFIDVVS